MSGLMDTCMTAQEPYGGIFCFYTFEEVVPLFQLYWIWLERCLPVKLQKCFVDSNTEKIMRGFRFLGWTISLKYWRWKKILKQLLVAVPGSNPSSAGVFLCGVRMSSPCLHRLSPCSLRTAAQRHADCCDCEHEWLFVSMCWPCNALMTYPGCPPRLAKCPLALAPAQSATLKR